VKGEVGIAHDAPALGGDFNYLSIPVQEVQCDGFQRVAASGKAAVDGAPGARLRVSAGFEDAEGGAPGAVARSELVFLVKAVEEPVLKEGRAQGPGLVAGGAEGEGGVDLAVGGGEEGGRGGALEELVDLGGDGRFDGAVGHPHF
jgi:hypothetical protein